jgi:hypothetical protein
VVELFELSSGAGWDEAAESVMVAFGHVSRIGLGMQLAYAGMYLMLAH